MALFDRITETVRRFPGVTDAAQAFIVPVSGSGWNNNIVIDGKKRKENVNFNRVSDRYFRTMDTPMLAGRDFDARDTLAGARVAIVTQSFARLFFGGRNPVGQTFQVDEAPGKPQPIYQIVGLRRTRSTVTCATSSSRWRFSRRRKMRIRLPSSRSSPAHRRLSRKSPDRSALRCTT